MKMKKFFTWALVFVVALMSSCSQDDFSGGQQTGEVDFTIKTSLPKSISTYSESTKGTDKGGASNVDKEKYLLRYICEAWTKENPRRLAWRSEQTVEDFSSAVEFKARLLAMNYDFVFWADFVDKENPQDKHYKTTNSDGLQDIELITGHGLSDDARDAYYAVQNVNLTQAGANITEVKLQRPFGKIRLVASDKVDGLLTDRPALAKIDYVQTTLPAGFNALTKLTTEKVVNLEETYTSVPVVEQFTVGGESKDCYVLSFDYIFASSSTPSVAFNVKSFSDEAGTKLIGNKDISAIPVVANKLTTVIGNLYTFDGKVSISVDDNFMNGEEIVPVVEVESVNLVADALKNSSAVKVVQKVSGTTVVSIPNYALPETMNAPAQISLDLSAGIEGEQTLTIEDNQTTPFTGTIAITVPDDNAGSVTINANKAHVIVYGKYGNIISQTSPTTLVVAKGAVVEKLTVTEGNAKIYGTVNQMEEVANGCKVYLVIGQGTDRLEMSIKDAYAEVKSKNYNGLVLTEGLYPLDANIDNVDGRNGWYFPIDKNGFELLGEGAKEKIIVYGREIKPNATWQTQNLITVLAENVCISGITMKIKVEANKTIEITKSGFVMEDCLVLPNDIVAGADLEYGGSVYFSREATSGTVNNCIIKKGTVSFDGIMQGNFTISNCQFEEAAYGDYPIISTPNWTSNDVTKSTMQVNITGTKFNGMKEFGSGITYAPVRPSYGTINLSNCVFPAKGCYWEGRDASKIVIDGSPVFTPQTIIDMIAGANDGDVISLPKGIYLMTSTIPVTKAVTINGAPDGGTILRTSGSKDLFRISGAATLSDLVIEKTDKANQTLCSVTGNRVTIKDSKFTGMYVDGDAEVTRGIVPNAGVADLTIEGNVFEALRQPAYLQSTGTVANNVVRGTRGWVVCVNYEMAFSGNSFENNAVDIAIIANNQASSPYYTDIASISSANNGASVEDQLRGLKAKDGQLLP